MDVHRVLQLADDILSDPLKAKFRTIWSGFSDGVEVVRSADRLRFTGVIDFIDLPQIGVTPFRFHHACGFQPADAVQPLVVSFPEVTPCLATMCPGDTITCHGLAKLFDAKIHFMNDVIICRWPQMVAEMPWNAIHLFSGGYMGWSRALSWLGKKKPECMCSQQVFVDADPMVMNIWNETFSQEHILGPIDSHASWKASPFLGVCTPVADETVARMAMFHSNLLTTLSPPCISWSKGGKSLGLNSEAGFSFVEAIHLISIVQPILVCAECSDETPNHPHFVLIKALFGFLGYKLVWEQIVSTHLLTHSYRTRWLAVWLRCDVPGKPIDAVFELRDSPVTPWHDNRNAFFVPEQIKSQLPVSCEAMQIYADPVFLPPAKRQKGLDSKQVLHLREAQRDLPLPTLCASYSAQHRLDSRHLRMKGVFASLITIDDCVCYLDPLRFISLLGTCDKIIIPVDLSNAFHCLGNCINVPHALLSCAVGFASVLDFHGFPSDIVLECWHDRLSPSTAVVAVNGDFLSVVSLFDFLCAPPVDVPEGDFGVDVFIKPRHSLQHFSGSVPLDLSLHDFMSVIVGLPEYLHHKVQWSSTGHVAPLSSTVGTVAHMACTWQLFVDSQPFLVVDLAISLTVEVPPTEPFDFDPQVNLFDGPVRTPSCSVDEFFDHPQLSAVLRLVEQNCNPTLNAPLKRVTGYVLFFPVNVAVHAFFPKNTFWNDLQAVFEKHKGSVALFECPTTTVLQHQLAVCFLPSDVPSEHAVCIIEDLATNKLECLLVPQLVSPLIDVQSNAGTFRFDHLNGNSITKSDQLVLHHADLISVRPKSQVDSCVRSGGHHATEQIVQPLPPGATFYQRCEYATNSHGWLATDELTYLAGVIQETISIPVPHYEVLLWQGGAADLECCFETEPDFPQHTCVWVFILIEQHWILCIIEIDRVSAHVVVQGCPEVEQASLISALARILDFSRSHIAATFLPVALPPHMCGWTFLQQFAERSNYYPQQLCADIQNLHPSFVEAIEDVLASSRDDWRTAGASPALCNFAHESRRLFLLHRASHTHISQVADGFRSPVSVPQASPPPVDSILARLRDLWVRPSWLPSDVLDLLLEPLRIECPTTLFAPPCIWVPEDGTFRAFNHFLCDSRPFGHVIVFVLWNTHWVKCEVLKNTSAWISVNGHAALRFEVGPMTSALVAWLGLDPATTHVTFQPHFPLPNMCGWSLALELFQRFNVDFLMPAVIHHLRLVLHPHAALINEIRALAIRQWQHDLVPQALISFGQSSLIVFICKLLEGRCVPDYGTGGGGDAKAPPAQASTDKPQVSPDPWLKRDPWQKPKSQTRWEDLLLADDHPFTAEPQQKLVQVHRLQVSANKGGLVLTTKQHLQELSQTRCKQPLAAIIPAIDTNAKNVEIASEGPYEVVLRDPNADLSYKRLVSLVVFSGKVSYHLHSPAHSFKTAAISELVIEIDSRLVSKEDFDNYKNAAASSIKKLFAENLPTCAGQATFYSFRHNVHPSASNGDIQLQAIVKIPTVHRRQILELSGQVGFLTRDFLEKGSRSSDTSIVPRFWPVTLRDLRDLLITLKPIQDHAGVALTRRGLAPRIWNSAIAQARQALVPDDNRLCAENYHVVPRISFEAAGWPPGTTPQDVVTAVNKATSCPPVPMRTYRLGGVNVWVLAFDKAPDKKAHQFTVQINDQLHEILLTEAPAVLAGKGGSKGKSKKKDFDPAPKASQPVLISSDRQRIDMLEAKFDSLGKQVSSIEEKQSIFENKIDSKFESINDNLRQLLQQSHPRPREGGTGDTPPPKHPKC